MFSGIIEEVGLVKKIDSLSKSKILTISCKKVLETCFCALYQGGSTTPSEQVCPESINISVGNRQFPI